MLAAASCLHLLLLAAAAAAAAAAKSTPHQADAAELTAWCMYTPNTPHTHNTPNPKP